MAVSLLSIKYFLMRAFSRYGRIVLRDHYVFVLKDVEKLNFEPVEGGKIVVYKRPEDIPQERWDELKNLLGPDYEASAHKLFEDGCRCYVYDVDGKIGSLVWAISGRNLKGWWYAIGPEDFVMFSGYTPPAFRGLRLHGKIIAAAYRAESSAGGKYYCDCNMANLASKKQLQNAGFELISREKRFKPLR